MCTLIFNKRGNQERTIFEYPNEPFAWYGLVAKHFMHSLDFFTSDLSPRVSSFFPQFKHTTCPQLEQLTFLSRNPNAALQSAHFF